MLLWDGQKIVGTTQEIIEKKSLRISYLLNLFFYWLSFWYDRVYHFVGNFPIYLSWGQKIGIRDLWSALAFFWEYVNAFTFFIAKIMGNKSKYYARWLCLESSLYCGLEYKKRTLVNIRNHQIYHELASLFN